MKVLHVVSNEVLFAFQNADTLTVVSPGSTLTDNVLYNCRRFVPGTGYETVQLYGMEVQAL